MKRFPEKPTKSMIAERLFGYSLAVICCLMIFLSIIAIMFFPLLYSEGHVLVLILVLIGCIALSTIMCIPFTALTPFRPVYHCPHSDAVSYTEGDLKVSISNMCRRCKFDYIGGRHNCDVTLHFKSFSDLEEYIVERILNGCPTMPESPCRGIDKSDGIVFSVNSNSDWDKDSQYSLEIYHMEDATGVLFHRKARTGVGRDHTSQVVEEWLKNFAEHLSNTAKVMDDLYYVD